jgi:hypothetical protein
MKLLAAVTIANLLGQAPLLAAAADPAPAGGAVVLDGVKILTDKSVDSSTPETIVKDLCKPGMSDEQKAIALFDWFERSVYHRPTPGDVNQNMYKVVNVYGGVVCGTQAAQMAALCRAAGLEARVTCDLPGAHTYYEVKYDGTWHGLDTMMRFYVYTRGEPRQIASFEAIDKDPTLAKDAVKENRACPGFLYHGDTPMIFVSDKLHRTLEYKSTAIPGLENLSLVPGQRITWFWYNVDKPHPQLKSGKGMAHSCARGADVRNPVNFAFWEPYYYEGEGSHPEQKSRRMYANGEIVFEPDLGAAAPLGFTELANLAGPGLVPQGDKPGTAMVRLHSPYVLVGGRLALKAAAGSDLAGVTVAVTRDGKNFKPASGKLDADGVLDLSAEAAEGWCYDFGVKVTMPNAKSALSGFKLELPFLHNKYVRPYLMAGDNEVKFAARNPETLGQCPVTVQYTWQEGPNWDQAEVKRHVQTVKDAASSTWKIKVGGEKYPRMKTLTVGAAWTPVVVKPAAVNTIKVRLKAVQFVNDKGEVAPTGRLQWPKNEADAKNVKAGTLLLMGDFSAVPTKGIAAVRLVVPVTKGGFKSKFKLGAVLLSDAIEAGKALDVKGLVKIAGTGIVPMQPDANQPEFKPALPLTMNITASFKDLAKAPTGIALRLVPDREVDQGYIAGCQVSATDPIVLEVDVYETETGK